MTFISSFYIYCWTSFCFLSTERSKKSYVREEYVVSVILISHFGEGPRERRTAGFVVFIRIVPDLHIV